jgi:hypothetical protein
VTLLRSFAGALGAESLKLRRTLALRMTVVAPAVVVALCVLQFGFNERIRGDGVPEHVWRFFAGATFDLWAFLMMPLVVTLEAALLAGLEHGERQWKHLLALPVPRAAHYLAKWTALVALLLVMAVAFAALIALGGSMLAWLHPITGIAGPPPWWWLLRACVAMVAAALLMATIQLWVAIRWSSFTVALATGIMAMVAGFMIGQSKYSHLYPWSLPIQVFMGKGGHATFALVASAVGAAIVLALSVWDFSRREVA